MSNTQTGKIDVVADGKTWSLQFSINGLCVLEADLGASDLTDIMGRMGATPSLTMLRTMFWAGLAEHHQGITKEEAGRIMQAVGLQRATEVVSLALMSALGVANGAAGPLAVPATAGGATSTPLTAAIG